MTTNAGHPQARVFISIVACIVVSACQRGEQGATGSAARLQGDTTWLDAAAPTCASCSIVAGPAVRVGGRGDREIPQRVPNIVRDGRGQIYLTFDGWSDKPILRYDSTGRYLGKLGASGQGPGEYDMTNGAFFDAHDSVYVVGWNGLLHIFGADGTFSRALRFPTSVIPVGVAPDGTIYGQRSSRYVDGGEIKQGPTLVMQLARDGTVRDSFPIFDATGVDTINFDGRGPKPMHYGEASYPVIGGDGSIWSYMRTNYRLEHYGANGASRQVFAVTAPDRPPPIVTRAQSDSQRAAKRAGARVATPAEAAKVGRSPRPKIAAQVDANGLVWVVRTIPAPRWDTITVRTDRLAPHEAPDEETIPREIEERLYHTIIEVIDPAKRQLLARHEIPFLALLVAPGYAGRITTDDDGFYVTTVFPITLRR
jgi:hypothetical protein